MENLVQAYQAYETQKVMPRVVTMQRVNMDYKNEEIDGKTTPVFWISCYDANDNRYFLGIHGDRVRPSFGVPYEEFWRIFNDERVTGYKRGPDSPLGEPVMEVYGTIPSESEKARRHFAHVCLTRMREM